VTPRRRAGSAGAGVSRGRKEAETGQGGGGGSAVPVGYIEISNGSAVFKPIRDPLVDVLVPLASLLAGFATPRMMRWLLRRGCSKPEEQTLAGHGPGLVAWPARPARYACFALA
jgi:hypothetical protein